MSESWATGSCLCGGVKYTLSSRPEKIKRFVCHCVLCKKASGSAFMTNWWMSEDVFSIDSGHENLGEFVVTETTSGNPVTRSFCRGCGSPIMLKTKNPHMNGMVGVTAGTLDFDIAKLREDNVALNWTPDGETYIEDRVLGFKALDGTQQVNGRG